VHIFGRSRHSECWNLRRGRRRRGALTLAAVVLLSGCSWFGSRPSTVPPAGKLYEEGEKQLQAGRYDQARESFARLAERHPESDLVPVAAFLVGEAYYRNEEYEKAAKEFDHFVTLYPSHAIADLGQYRLARTYFDQMPIVERDQGVTLRALTEFQRLIRLYPESRYAPDSIAKIEACRLRLAEKELWVADYYMQRNNPQAALQRYDAVLKDFSRTAAVPETLYRKADLLIRLNRNDEAQIVLRRLVEQYPQSDWSARGRQRQTRLTTP
jgi:outer membrane protein assembly factor BamD